MEGWCILAGPRWPRLPLRDGAPPQTLGPYYSAIYITEYHSSKTHSPLPPFLSLELRDTIRPVCYEGRVVQSRQGHDNKLADGCGEKNKGHRRLDIISIAISQNLASGACRKRVRQSTWSTLKGLKGCSDRHPLTSNDIEVAWRLDVDMEACGVQISQEELSEKFNVSYMPFIKMTVMERKVENTVWLNISSFHYFRISV